MMMVTAKVMMPWVQNEWIRYVMLVSTSRVSGMWSWLHNVQPHIPTVLLRVDISASKDGSWYESRVCWHQRNCLNHQVPWDMLLSYMIFFWPKWEWNGLFLYTDSGQDHRMMYVHINLVISYCPLPESQSTFRLPSCCQDCSSPFLEESSGEDDVHPQSRLSEYWPHEVGNEWASRNHIEELQQHCTLQKSRWAIA